MTKKKILIIASSCISVVILILVGIFLWLNWNKIAATEDAYNILVKERDALIKQVEDYKSQIDSLLEENAELVDMNSSLDKENVELSSKLYALERELYLVKNDNKLLQMSLDKSYEDISLLKAELSETLASKYNLDKPNDNCILLTFSDNRFSYPDLNFDEVVEMPPVYVDVTQEFKLPAYNGTAPEGWAFAGWAYEPINSFIDGDLIHFSIEDEEVFSANTFDLGNQYIRFYAVFVPIET